MGVLNEVMMKIGSLGIYLYEEVIE